MKESTELEQAFLAISDQLPHEGSTTDMSLIDILPGALYTCNAEGFITAYNKKATELWGRSQNWESEKIKFSGADKLYYPEGKLMPFTESPEALSLKDGIPRKDIEVGIERPDQTKIMVMTSVIPLKNSTGDVTGTLSCFHEIFTDRIPHQELEWQTKDLKIKNEELKRSEERYHKMIEEVEDYAIILLDRNGIIQNWNKGAENIKGYKEREIVGKSFESFYLEDDIKRGLPKALLNRALTEGKAIHEGWRKRKDGSRFWGSIVLTAVHDNSGSVLGFTKVTRDLTERKLAEDKMKEYTDKLEFQNKELEQFAYAASHDMKEPLRKIHIYNSIVLDNVGDQLDEKSRDYLKRSINAASKMSGLIEDLLVYSRTTSSIENAKPVDLNEIMDEFMHLHKEDVEHNHVQIEVNKLPVINGVAFQLKQLFTNIISNSIKYKHPDRELVIKIDAEFVHGSQACDENLEANEQYHKISITDNGIGFEQQYADRIFDIFERLHNAAKAPGTGIGLAICKRIMQNHEGCIKATGRLNEGARFDLYFPIN